MIGVIPKQGEAATVEEFFQLFKTPWEWYRPGIPYDVVLVTGDEPASPDAKLLLIFGSEVKAGDGLRDPAPGPQLQNARLRWEGGECPLYGPLLTFGPGNQAVLSTLQSAAAAVEVASEHPKTIRLGYDLFEEAAFLLKTGQPVENASIPTLDLHVEILRGLIVKSGLPLVEIPPVPSGYDFAVCLTHDIDFVGIRRHKFDHTMFGFLYRATLGAALSFLRGRVSFRRLLGCWKAAATLPLVYLGMAQDFWMPFEWYLAVEMNLSATYFLIPFKRRRGARVHLPHADRRASAYDVGDIPEWVARLQAEGCEVGVHGVDAWNSVERGREELNRVARFSGSQEMGVRMHWLMRDANTIRVLEQAGYTYDSTSGYNEVPGYLNGTTQVFRPPGAKSLLELPMHIQDGALFFPGRLGLTDAAAARVCEDFTANARKFGGVLTFIWHDRSHAPERFWGDFYAALVQKLKAGRTWFGQARQVVSWFRQRRGVSFETGREGGIKIRGTGVKCSPPMRIRVHRADGVVEWAWDGERDIEPMPLGASATGQPELVHAA